MPKRTSDGQTKAPLSAFAARRSRQAQAEQQQQQDDNRSKDQITLQGESNEEATRTVTLKTESGDQTPKTRTESDDNREGYSSGKERESTKVASSLVSRPEQIAYSFQPNDSNYSQYADGVCVELQPEESIVFHGEYKLTVNSGSVNIMGAKLGPQQTAAIYAPSTHSLPRIEIVSEPVVGNPSVPVPANLSITNLKSGLGDVGGVCPTFKSIFKSCDEQAYSFSPAWELSNTASVLDMASWKPALAAIAEVFLESKFNSSPSPVILVTGSKSTGKSTFCRALANILMTSSAFAFDVTLNRVGFLDIDPGQPTFTPPAVVSLRLLEDLVLGPPFACVTNHDQSERLHHIGYTSPKDDPEYYVACVLDLLRHHFTHFANQGGPPLIVNTPGWTKGMGREILQQILIEGGGGITDIVALGNPEEAAAFVAELAPERCGVLRSHFAAPAPPLPPSARRYTPADLRMLQTICYFHQSASPSIEVKRFDFSTRLPSQVPWVGSFFPPSSAAISGLTILDAEIPEELAARAISGTIVSIDLVRAADEERHGLLARLQANGNRNGPIPYVSPSSSGCSTSDLLPPSLTQTVGLAILRNIDMNAKEIHFLTPIPAERLGEWESEGFKVIFVRGRAEMPVWLFWTPEGDQTDGHASDGSSYSHVELPYLNFDSGRTSRIKGGKEWRVRRNVMRRSQARLPEG